MAKKKIEINQKAVFAAVKKHAKQTANYSIGTAQYRANEEIKRRLRLK